MEEIYPAHPVQGAGSELGKTPPAAAVGFAVAELIRSGFLDQDLVYLGACLAMRRREVDAR